MAPRQPHGLGDAFLQGFLQSALAAAAENSSLPLSLSELAALTLSDARVDREWHNIDILVRSATNRLAVVIENKVWSGEHSDQLDRYHSLVAQHHPGWRILHIFLTPTASQASHKEYLPVGYDAIIEIIDDLLNRTRSTLNADAVVLLRHYVQMLRRHIVDDPEIEALCRQVYQKHHRALDLIYQYRPDRQARLQGFLESLVRDAGGFDLDTRDPRRSPRYIVFAAKAWEDFEPTPPTDWHSMSLYFENKLDKLVLKLALSEDLTERHERVFAVARQNLPFCKPVIRSKYNWVYERVLLNPREWNDAEEELLFAEIESQWNDFLQGDFLRMGALLRTEFTNHG
jgi:hypothetical protein